jgi:glycosyltransferase involved in cell wall biosynthesis
MQADIAIIMVVRNEEEQIRECLETVSWANEIIIVDQSSTDSTAKISRQFTDKIFLTEPKGYCEPDRNLAIEKASSKWIFYIDADERVTRELRDEILLIVKSDNPRPAYYVKRRNYFLGKWIKTCDWYPSPVLRLFKKGEVIFPNEIHQVPQHREEYGYLNNDLLHYSYSSFEEYFEKFNRYTTELAKEEFQTGRRITAFNFIPDFLLRPSYNFLSKYLYYQGYRDGFRGFFVSFSSALTVFVSKAKLWEIRYKQK